MSIYQIRTEVDSLIQESGMQPSMKMQCSLLRTLKMRHCNLDIPLASNIIKTTIKELL
jgi:hypothetical protein